MPILDDIMDHNIIGPAIRKGLEQGRREGRLEAMREGELAFLRRLISKRFGALPTGIDDRLARFSIAELEELADRLLDAKSIADLFGGGETA